MVSALNKIANIPDASPLHTAIPQHRETVHNLHKPPGRPHTAALILSRHSANSLDLDSPSARIYNLDVTCINRFVLSPLTGISALPFALRPHNGKLLRQCFQSITDPTFTVLHNGVCTPRRDRDVPKGICPTSIHAAAHFANTASVGSVRDRV